MGSIFERVAIGYCTFIQCKMALNSDVSDGRRDLEISAAFIYMLKIAFLVKFSKALKFLVLENFRLYNYIASYT